MEGRPALRAFLATEEGLAEARLRSVSRVLELETAGLPGHILEALGNLRQNAEEDLSNILHIQSTLPGVGGARSPARPQPSPARAGRSLFGGDSGPLLGQVEEAPEGPQVETGLAATDLFLLDGLQEDHSPLSAPFTDEETEDSEQDEGIHMPGRRAAPCQEVAASLPVGIPWTLATRGPSGRLQGTEDLPPLPARDIAASMAAIARSVHTSSMFGDTVFGDLPRPRLNTASKD